MILSVNIEEGLAKDAFLYQNIRRELTDPEGLMKITTKISMLVAGGVVMTAGALVVSTLINLPVEAVNRESRDLTSMVRAALELRSTAMASTLLPISDVRETVKTAQDNFSTVVGKAKTLTTLRGLGPDVAKALEAVGNLRALTEGYSESFLSSFDDVYKAADDLGVFKTKNQAADTKMGSLFFLEREPDRAQQWTALRYYLSKFQGDLATLDQALVATITVIDKQDAVIAAKVAEFRSTTSGITAAISALFLTGLIVFGFLMGRRINRSLKAITKPMSQIASGDLRVRFALTNRDEIGVLSRELDGLFSALEAALERIQDAAKENNRLKDKMLDSVHNTTSSAEQIQANSESILGQMETLDGRIKASEESVEAMAAAVRRFGEKIEEQTGEVAGTVDLVRSMLSSLETIGKIVDEDKTLTQDLVQASENARAVFETSFDRITTIGALIREIQEIAGAISGLASQTNILSLNAAIEAAHAGESGKGFAVVSDEIGKLASESAASSEEIANKVKGIVEVIELAVRSKDEVAETFGSLDRKIHQVTDSVSDIFGHLDGIQAGSQHVLQSMDVLNDRFVGIGRDTTVLGDGTAQVATVFQDLGRISHEVVSSSSEIGLGLRQITGSILVVSQDAVRLGETSQSLDDAMRTFKTTREV